MNGNIFDIQRFCIHDGPGIRTTVFLKGCPLKCVWCHNPESQKSDVSIAFYSEKCIFCGACAEACDLNCHSFGDGVHVYNRDKCIACGKCAGACSTESIERLGKKVTAADVIDEVARDCIFYKNSGGGLTVSGGEPLMQPDFLFELLTEAKRKGIHTCVETCGFSGSESLKRISPLTDIFLYDIKETDGERHKELTGVPLSPILENLYMLDGLGAKTVLRCPIVPGKNLRREHLIEVARLCASLKNAKEINIMAYHTLGSAKYEALSMPDEMKGVPPMSNEEKADCVKIIEAELLRLGVTDVKVC